MSRKPRGRSKASQQHRRGFGPKNSRFLWMGGIVVVVAVVSLVLVNGLLQKSGKTEGAIAPDITLSTRAGDFRLFEQRGNVVVLFYSFPG